MDRVDSIGRRRLAAAFASGALCLAAGACGAGAGDRGRRAAVDAPAPEFAGIERWFNGPPLRMDALRGRVVLVEFWTYSCINCLHVMPHVRAWHARYADDGLVVVGVHTPEYDEERDAEHLRRAIARLGIAFPVAQDNAYATWDAYGNRFWPALYLVDRDGKIAYRHVGEGDYDVTEARIRALLAAR